MDRDDDHANGDQLRRERTRRRLTLAQVAQATRIRERYLTAIENDDVDSLPNPVYTIGFIRIYARFLDLNPDPFIRVYKRRIGTTPPPEVRTETTRDAYVPARGRSLLVPAIGVVLFVVLVGYLYQQVAMYASGASASPRPPGTSIALVIPTPLPTPPPPPSPSPTPVPPSPTPIPTAKPTATALATAASAQPAATLTPDHGVRIDTEINGRVWLQVEADGKVVFSGILVHGDKRTWTGTRSVMLWSGNAGNVMVTFNGKPLGAMGPLGKVLKVTWVAPV